MTDTILEYIRREYLDEEEAQDLALDANTPLITSGIVDSFSMVSLKRFLEKTYGVRIPDERATPEAFDSAARIAALVESLRKGA